MHLKKISVFLLLLAPLTACNSQSSAEDMTKEIKSVQSWMATTRLVGDAWARGDVPTAYARQTLNKAQGELQKESQELAKKLPQKQSYLLDSIQKIEVTAKQMSIAIEHQNRSAIAEKINQLSKQEQEINIIAQKLGEQS